jgi:hypothetical protein
MSFREQFYFFYFFYVSKDRRRTFMFRYQQSGTTVPAMRLVLSDRHKVRSESSISLLFSTFC